MKYKIKEIEVPVCEICGEEFIDKDGKRQQTIYRPTGNVGFHSSCMEDMIWDFVEKNSTK